MKIEDLIKELKNNVEKEKKVVRELTILFKQFIRLKGDQEKKMMASQIQALKKHLKESNDRASRNLRAIYLAKPLPKIDEKSSPNTVASLTKKAEPKTLEKQTQAQTQPIQQPVQQPVILSKTPSVETKVEPTKRKKSC